MVQERCDPKDSLLLQRYILCRSRECYNRTDLTTWKEIVSGYRDNVICECEKFNPTGECCCEQNFYDVVNQVLESIGKEPIPPEEQCCG